MNGSRHWSRACVTAVLGLACSASSAAHAQQPSAAAIIQGVDAEVASRVKNVLAFTDIEHYAVYRGNDETHPVAQMTVRDAYKKGAGKTYTILSQSGSGIVLRFGLRPLVEHETNINKPGRVEDSWFTSANYKMRLKPGGMERVNGRNCYALAITPKYKATKMIEGTLWVDAKDYSIVKVQGIASKKPFVFAGTTHMMRQYVNIDGYPMATYAHAESDSFLFGRTVLIIDYTGYHLKVRPDR